MKIRNRDVPSMSHLNHGCFQKNQSRYKYWNKSDYGLNQYFYWNIVRGNIHSVHWFIQSSLLTMDECRKEEGNKGEIFFWQSKHYDKMWQVNSIELLKNKSERKKIKEKVYITPERIIPFQVINIIMIFSFNFHFILWIYKPTWFSRKENEKRRKKYQRMKMNKRKIINIEIIIQQ